MENKFNTFEEDLLDRKNLAINLTKIILDVISSQKPK